MSNPVPMKELSTYEVEKDHYKNRVRHDWSRAKHGMITCRTCRIRINKNDKVFNLYCSDEGLEVIERLKGIDYLLDHQPLQKELWSNKKRIMFSRKGWNKWIRSMRAQVRRQE